jgi:hypothetical protein
VWLWVEWASRRTASFRYSPFLLAGLGVSAITARALTRAIGQVFVESFENGATARD